MEKLTLEKPIQGESKEISELTLNFDVLSVGDFRQIQKLEALISDNASMSVKDMSQPKKLSFEFHLACGFLAAVKGTDGLKISDFLKLSMQDSLRLEEYGSFFCMNVL